MAFALSLLLFQSPADRCKKIHAGDEVIQVNHQTVVSVSIIHNHFTFYLLTRLDRSFSLLFLMKNVFSVAFCNCSLIIAQQDKKKKLNK